jgi:hypothetical protein
MGGRFLRNTGTQIVPLLYTDDRGRRLLRTYISTKLHGVTSQLTAGLRFVGQVGRLFSQGCAPNYDNVWGSGGIALHILDLQKQIETSSG